MIAPDLLQTSEERVAIHVHPTVVMSINNHVTRSRFATPPAMVVGGAIVGAVSSTVVEAVLSCDVALIQTATGWEFEMAEVRDRTTKLLMVYPQYELLGWYVTRSQWDQSDVAMASALRKIGVAHPLLILCDPDLPNAEVPLRTYFIRDGVVKHVSFTWQPEETERIAIDAAYGKGVAKNITMCAPQVESSTKSVRTAVDHMSQQIDDLCQFLSDVEKGASVDPELLREVATVAIMAQHPSLAMTADSASKAPTMPWRILQFAVMTEAAGNIRGLEEVARTVRQYRNPGERVSHKMPRSM